MAEKYGIELVKRIRQGDVQAYETLFRGMYRALSSYAFTYLKDKDDSEEAVQQVFLKIWEKHSSIDVQQSFEAYLYRSVKNECLNRLKHRKVKLKYQAEAVATEEDPHDSSDTMVTHELQEKIHTAIGDLPEQCRIIFKMSRFEEKKYHEIAGELGLSVKTVENQIGKALRVLRGRLADFLPFILFAIITIIRHVTAK